MFIIRFFQMGGLFMLPIALTLAVGLAIAFERWVQLKRDTDANKKLWDLLYPSLVKGEFDKAREIANKDKSSMAQMLGMGLARQGAVRRREDIEIAMEESMMEIVPQLEKRTPYLALLSNIATLFGLLGTIMGLIMAFGAVATASPAEKAIRTVRTATTTARANERESAGQKAPESCCSRKRLRNQRSDTPRSGKVSPPLSPWNDRTTTQISGA